MRGSTRHGGSSIPEAGVPAIQDAALGYRRRMNISNSQDVPDGIRDQVLEGLETEMDEKLSRLDAIKRGAVPADREAEFIDIDIRAISELRNRLTSGVLRQ